MKTNTALNNQPFSKSTFSQACISCCKKVLAQIDHAKGKLLHEFKGTLHAQEHLLQLALNEAEALAWQSGVPQLVFADLAMEKAQAIATWQSKQRQMV